MTKNLREHRSVYSRLEKTYRLLHELTDRWRYLLDEEQEEVLDDAHDKIQELLKKAGYTIR